MASIFPKTRLTAFGTSYELRLLSKLESLLSFFAYEFSLKKVSADNYLNPKKKCKKLIFCGKDIELQSLPKHEK